MINRCYQLANAGYKHYGARGITVADRWHKFENFLEDMGERPEGCTLGRHGDQGNYEPGNVSWQTIAEQSVKGEKQGKAKLTEEQVLVMRALYQPNSHSNSHNMARDLKMNKSTVYDAIIGRTWRHI